MKIINIIMSSDLVIPFIILYIFYFNKHNIGIINYIRNITYIYLLLTFFFFNLYNKIHIIDFKTTVFYFNHDVFMTLFCKLFLFSFLFLFYELNIYYFFEN